SLPAPSFWGRTSRSGLGPPCRNREITDRSFTNPRVPEAAARACSSHGSASPPRPRAPTRKKARREKPCPSSREVNVERLGRRSSVRATPSRVRLFPPWRGQPHGGGSVVWVGRDILPRGPRHCQSQADFPEAVASWRSTRRR